MFGPNGTREAELLRDVDVVVQIERGDFRCVLTEAGITFGIRLFRKSVDLARRQAAAEFSL